MLGSLRAAATVAVSLVVVIAGCGPAGTSDSPTSAPPPQPPSSSASTTSASENAGGVTNGNSYGVTPRTIEGTTPDGPGRWTVEFNALSGGDPGVVEAFNKASETAAREQLAKATASAETGSAEWSFESKGQVSFRSIAIAQAINGQLGYGAHPTQYTATIVIDGRTAAPITLADLFTDEKAGLQRLSEQTKTLVPKEFGAEEVMEDQDGNAPVEKNYLNWVPVADGMEIFFEPYQFGTALPATITIPWSELTDVLAPEMAGLATG